MRSNLKKNFLKGRRRLLLIFFLNDKGLNVFEFNFAIFLYFEAVNEIQYRFKNMRFKTELQMVHLVSVTSDTKTN
jgi:hypothetical protein